MHVVSDDERREVAERLRAKLAEGSPHSIHESVCYALGKTENEGNWDVITRLADLIDPGESGHESGQNRDTVQKESSAVQKTPECDREALLVEAEESERCAWYFALYHDEDELRDRLTEAAEDFSGIARRIREACGEVAG